MFNKDSEANNPYSQLPDEIIAEIEEISSKSRFSWVLSWIPFFVMVAGFIVGIWLWIALEGAVENRVLSIAIEHDAWLYNYHFGVSMLTLLFAWIFISGMISTAAFFFLPSRWKSAFVVWMIADSNSGKMGIKALNKAYRMAWDQGKNISALADISDLVVLNMLRTYAKFVVPLLTITTLLLTFEFQAYDIYSTEGLTQKPYFPVSKTQTYPWSAVDSVALGCNQTDDGASLIYEPRWLDGPSPRLGSLDVLGEQSRLEALETIDEILVENGATFERWHWLKRDPLHPECLGIYRAAVGPENASRIDRLLRVGEFPGDSSGNDI